MTANSREAYAPPARNAAPAMPEILCLGEAMVEFNQQPDKGDGAQPLFLQGFGGDTSNCAIAAARQGARVGYISALGADTFGDALLDLWHREAVDTRFVSRNPEAHTAVYFVTHGPDGHAFHYLRAGSAASRMQPAALPKTAIAAAKILQFSGISLAISRDARATCMAAVELARAAGVKVAFDTNLRLRLWSLDEARAAIDAAMSCADIGLPSLDDATALTGLDDPERIVTHYLGLGTKLVALKLGPGGVLLAGANLRHLVPGHRVTAIDATGAGDTFDGAFLARLVAGDDPIAAARYANAAAALSVTGYGAVAPIPRRAAVEALLAS